MVDINKHFDVDMHNSNSPRSTVKIGSYHFIPDPDRLCVQLFRRSEAMPIAVQFSEKNFTHCFLSEKCDIQQLHQI